MDGPSARQECEGCFGRPRFYPLEHPLKKFLLIFAFPKDNLGKLMRVYGWMLISTIVKVVNGIL